MSDEIKQAIETSATDGIQSATGEGGSVTKTSIPDQIAAAKFLQGQSAAVSRSRGLIFTRLKPPGAV